MKKTYLTPTTDVIAIQPSKIICTSGDPYGYPYPFGYVPMHKDDENLMA